MTINLIRLESVLKNASATCEDPDNRRGALFCANCGRHDDDCPCEGCDEEYGDLSSGVRGRPVQGPRPVGANL